MVVAQNTTHACTHGNVGVVEVATTVCPGSSDPPEKIFNILARQNEVYRVK